MVWKQDLAKLKHAFREAGGPPPPPPKPKPKPPETKDLVDEDAMFLAAMGTPAAPARVLAAPAPPAPPPPVEPPLSFEEGLADLRGLKPLARNPVVLPERLPSAPPPPRQVEAAPVESAPPTMPAPPASAPSPLPEPPVSAKLPVRIQLAAGMAVEVDAVLDLRGHSVPDALGRLGDRMEDGALMGWRTLHLILGEDPALHEALLAFLRTGAASRIGRYAQAPIPMGGSQAWVLYY